jgi:hypothetical protein
MKKLWRKTAELFRMHPVLWTPYVAAELLAICLWRLRGVAEKGIFRWFLTRHSVLGGDIAVPNTDHAALARASIAYAPIGLATIFVVVFVFVVALVVTASLVDAIGREQTPDLRELLAGLVPRWRRILLFSLVFLVAFGVFAAGAAGILFCLLYAVHRPDLLTSAIWPPAFLLVSVGCPAWLLMPAAIRLLRADKTMVVSVQARNWGTIIAILATEAGVGLGMVLQKAEARIMLDSRWELTVLSALNSILANAPDVLLFIALALLASENWEEVEKDRGSKVRELFQILMPLHLRQNREP